MKIDNFVVGSKPNSHFKSHTALLICLAMILFTLIPFVTALNFDNSKNYDSKTKTVTITNAFGFGDKIADIKLNTPQINYVIPGANRKVAEFTINNLNSYSNAFNRLEFYDINKDMEKFERDFIYKYKSGSKWIEINPASQLPVGKITIGIFTTVLPFDNVEWIPTLFGVEVEEWAQWTGSLNVDLMHYFPFNETSGTVAQNVINGTANITTSNGQQVTAGIIGAGYNATTGDEVDTDINLTGYSNISINFWINETGDIPNSAIFSSSTTQKNGTIRAFYSSNSFSLRVEGVTDSAQTNNRALENNKFQMITLVINDTFAAMYQNGTLWWNESTDWIPTTNFFRMFGQPASLEVDLANVTLDELAIWNRTLSVTEITQLYNNGEYIQFDALTITLNDPANNSESVDNNVSFNCTGSLVGTGSISNVSLFVDGILNFTQAGVGQSTELFLPLNLSFGEHNWTCDVESISGSKKTATTRNLTTGILENSQTFNSTTFETSTEDFIINLTYNNSHYTVISANLVYNGTSYAGTKSGANSEAIFTKTLNIPIITIDNNVTFYWDVSLTSPTGTSKFNSTFNNQSVNNISIGECAGSLNTVALNFTAYTEANATKILGWDFKGTFFYYTGGGGGTTKNLSIDSQDIVEQTVCINQNTTFFFSSVIEYNSNSTGFVTRNYFFDNETINNVTQNISLYLLNSSDSTSFILKVVDQNQSNVEGALIHTQRYYPESDTFRTVQIAKTDKNGKSVGFFKTETVDYRFLIEKDGVTELLTSTQKVVPEVSPFTLTFTIGNPLDKPWADFDDLELLDYSLVFEASTNITTFTYLDSSGNFTQARLLVVEEIHNQSNTVICNTTSADSSATITCDASAFSGSFVANGLVTRTVEKTVTSIRFVINSIVEIMGLTGLILGWFIILVAGCSMLWHPIAGIIGIDFAIIVVNLVGLISFSGLFIFSALAVSVILIIVIKD